MERLARLADRLTLFRRTGFSREEVSGSTLSFVVRLPTHSRLKPVLLDARSAELAPYLLIGKLVVDLISDSATVEFTS